MIAGEADADSLADRLSNHQTKLCSSVARWETLSALCRSYKVEVAASRMRVDSFIRESGLSTVPIAEREYDLAAEAYERFGRGRHPAALNMGDCFAYACARANAARLLFKGEDFGRTDIAPA